jgi:hypothetical protein
MSPSKTNTALTPHTAAPKGNQTVAMFRLRCLAIIVVAIAVVQWLYNASAHLLSPTYQVDFTVYYAAALALHAHPGANITSMHVLTVAAAVKHGAYRPEFPYLYTPLLAVLIQPLTWIAPNEALSIWTAFNLMLWLSSTALLITWVKWAVADVDRDARVHTGTQVEPPTRCTWWRVPGLALATMRRRQGSTTYLNFAVLPFMVFATLTYEPLEHTVILGQVAILILFLILLTPLLLRKGLPELAGGVLALATLIKLLPLVLIVYFAARGQWRVVLGAVTGFLVLTAGMVIAGVPITLIVSSIAENGAARDQLFHSWNLFYNNESLSQVPLWVAAELGMRPNRVTTLLGGILIGLVAVAFAGGTLASTWRAWRTVRSSGAPRSRPTCANASTDLLGYSWAIATMLLASPVTWQHYDAWLLPPCALSLGHLVRRLGASLRTEQGRLKWEVILLGATLAGYVLTRNALPFNYDSAPQLTVGPYLGALPVRPFFMVLRPLGAALIWIAVGTLFLRTLQIEPSKARQICSRLLYALHITETRRVSAATQSSTLGDGEVQR